MRSSSVSNLGKLVALLAALAALSYAVTRMTVPASVAAPESRPAMPSPQASAFVMSGGLVADLDPSVPPASEALQHAAATVATSEDASTF